MAKKYKDCYTVNKIIDPVTQKAKTELTYTGAYFYASVSKKALLRTKILLVVCAAVNAASFTAAGFTAGETGRSPFSLLAYAVLFLPSAFLVISSLRLIRTGERFTLPDCKLGFERARSCGFVILILGVWCAVAGFIIAREDILFICATAACALCGALVFWLLKGIKLKEENPPA